MISGGSATADHQVTVVLFDDPLAPQRFSIAATVRGSTNVVEPRLLFSPNCQVVVMIGADADPNRQRIFRAEVQDLVQRKRICSVTSGSSQFQVQLLPPAAGNQLLRVSSGGQQTDCPVF